MNALGFQIAAARRMLAAAGLDPHDIAGQVTARAEGEDAMWTSTMDLFEATSPREVVKIPFDAPARDNKAIDASGGPAPVTTASRWIAALYRVRPDIGCVIHTHAPYIVAVSSTGETVGLYSNRSVLFYDEQSFFDDDGTATDDPDAIVRALGSRSILIQRNHGAVVTGPDVPTATAVALLLEAGARYHVLAKSAGGKPFPSNDAFLTRRVPHLANLPLVWEAHLRRLRRLDPSFFEAFSSSS